MITPVGSAQIARTGGRKHDAGMATSRGTERLHEPSSGGSSAATPVDDLIEEALVEARAAVRGRRISVHVPHDLPLAAVDPARAVADLRQALNDAVAEAPEASELSIGASAWKGTIDIRVSAAGGASAVVSFPEAGAR